MLRYVVHVGPHKTGTTYLQLRLAQAAAALNAAGVLYPETWRAGPGLPSHHGLFRRLRDGQTDQLRQELAALPVPADGTVVLSAEDLQFLEPPEIAGLAAALGTPDVTIVYYCRRWSELLPSVWQERVKHGDAQPLHDFLLTLAQNPHRSMLTHYGAVLDRYGAVFGASRVRVVSYNNLAESGLDLADHFVASFLPSLPGPLPPPADPRPNPSMSATDIEFVRVLNALHRRDGGQPGSAARHWYLRRKQALRLEQVQEAMQRATTTVTLSDTVPAFDLLHRQLRDRYAAALVPPAAPDRLFTPAQNEIPTVGSDYLLTPEVAMAMHSIYRQFRQEDGSGNASA
jgi:hypothetical protein